MEFLGIVLFTLLFIVFIYLWGIRGTLDSYIYDYKITRKGIEFALFKRIPIFMLMFEDIATIRKVSRKEWFRLPNDYLFALYLVNRIWGQRIFIRRKKGIIKRILITPEDADAFVDKVLLCIDANVDSSTSH